MIKTLAAVCLTLSALTFATGTARADDLVVTTDAGAVHGLTKHQARAVATVAYQLASRS